VICQYDSSIAYRIRRRTPLSLPTGNYTRSSTPVYVWIGEMEKAKSRLLLRIAITDLMRIAPLYRIRVSVNEDVVPASYFYSGT
jgi:hypothetical protein